MSPITDTHFLELIAGSYQRLLGQSLIPPELTAEAGAHWLYEEAPFAVLAHNTADDPVFVYGNRRAQQLFEYDWHELTALPSRLSAEAPERSERQAFLEQVSQHGFVTGYRGVRVTRSGKRFWIERATVWQLVDASGIYRGQAAMIPQARTIGN